MTEPTTVFDLSPKGVEKLREELGSIDWALPLYSAGTPAWRTLTRRRDRIIAALDTLPREG